MYTTGSRHGKIRLRPVRIHLIFVYLARYASVMGLLSRMLGMLVDSMWYCHANI